MADWIEDDVRAIAGIDVVPSILEVVCRVTGMGFAAVARVTETHWIACAVRDEIDFGLKPGGELELATTICNEIRASGAGVVIDHVAEDPLFATHHTPARYGFQSYISMPIVRANGDFFGTLCAIDPRPAKLANPGIISTFERFAELIALQLDAQERLAISEAALLDSHRTAELREQFIAVLGHDLRNPLAAIEAGTRLLEKSPLDERGSRILSMMQNSTRRMGRLIEDVLDLARGRLGGGLPMARRDERALAAALAEIVDELRAAHPQRRIEASFAITQAVVCDPARIAQLLSNLLANALAYGDHSEPVQVDARVTDDMLRLAVTNSGNPIAADRITTLFQPFTRMEGQMTKGLGLGLYIVGEIAKAHGGTIEVTSDAHRTRFTLVMPCGVTNDGLAAMHDADA